MSVETDVPQLIERQLEVIPLSTELTHATFPWVKLVIILPGSRSRELRRNFLGRHQASAGVGRVHTGIPLRSLGSIPSVAGSMQS